jgi:hypothetical protein
MPNTSWWCRHQKVINFEHWRQQCPRPHGHQTLRHGYLVLKIAPVCILVLGHWCLLNFGRTRFQEGHRRVLFTKINYHKRNRGFSFSLKCDFYIIHVQLKPHCIQSSRVLVPAGTSKSMLHRHGIQAITRVMAYVTNAVTLSSTMHTGGFELASSTLTSSTLKWLHRIQCGFKSWLPWYHPRSTCMSHFKSNTRTSDMKNFFCTSLKVENNSVMYPHV